MDRSQGRARVTVREPSAAKLPESMRNESGFAGGSSYSASQIRTAWRFMSRGDKDGLRKRDVDLLVRTFRPNITANELEQIVGPIKGRVTYSSLRTILQSSALPQVLPISVLSVHLPHQAHASRPPMQPPRAACCPTCAARWPAHGTDTKPSRKALYAP